MNCPVILYEDECWQRFLPLVYLRGIYELRCGIGALWQRVERLALEEDASAQVSLWCRGELAQLVSEQTGRSVNQTCREALLLNGRGFWRSLPETYDESSWVGTAGVGGAIACVHADQALASELTPDLMQDVDRLSVLTRALPHKDVSSLVTLLDWPWELIDFNSTAIVSDWNLAQLQGINHPPDPGVFLLNPGQIHIGPGTRLKPCTVIDAEEGPVWIGANVTVQPHACIQGPCYIGNECLVQPGAVIHEGCSFGRRCKVGGEVEASIIQSFSNKQHDGFLGHSYLGEWINIGADSLNSDLKNTYGTVRVPINGQDVETHRQFAGLLMGDFSKTGINVAFPTGAVVGVCTSIVDLSPPKFAPSFTWLEPGRRQPFDIERGLTSARRMMARRNRELSPALEEALRHAQQQSQRIEMTDAGA